MRNIRLIIIIIFMPLAIAGNAMADTGIGSIPETQGFSTSTASQLAGIATETNSIVWQIGDGTLAAPPLSVGQIIGTMSYTESTIADQGLVTYSKLQSLDTEGATPGTSNFNIVKVVEFDGLNAGRMISEENEVLDIADYGYNNTSQLYICPFATQLTNETPGYCNIVEMGSTVDVTLASLSTTAGVRTVPIVGDPGASWKLGCMKEPRPRT
jgi:hypothetical protein